MKSDANNRAHQFIANVLIDIGLHFRDELAPFGFEDVFKHADKKIYYPPSKEFLEEVIAAVIEESRSNQSRYAEDIEVVKLYAETWAEWCSSEGPSWQFFENVFRLCDLAGIEFVSPAMGKIFESNRQRSNAVRGNEKFAKSRKYCIDRAAALWESEPLSRMGEMLDTLVTELQEGGHYVPGQKKVREYLIEASKKGELKIPPEAQRPGRPKASRSK